MLRYTCHSNVSSLALNDQYSLLIGKAASTASQFHEGHVDRDGLPHFFHCMRVAMKQKTPHAMVVALLHDCVEDAADAETQAEIIGLIGRDFGEDVKHSCILLTEVEGEGYEAYIKRIIGSGNFEAMEIKKADIEDNTKVGRVDMKAAQKFPIYKAAHMALCEALGIQSDLSLSSQE